MVSSISSEKLSGNCTVPLNGISCFFLVVFPEHNVSHTHTMIIVKNLLEELVCLMSAVWLWCIWVSWCSGPSMNIFHHIWESFQFFLLSPLFETLITTGRLAWTRLSEVKVMCKLLSHVWLFATRILEWVAFPFLRRSSQPRDWTQVSCITGKFFTSWATREAHWGFSYFFHYFPSCSLNSNSSSLTLSPLASAVELL